MLNKKLHRIVKQDKLSIDSLTHDYTRFRIEGYSLSAGLRIVRDLIEQNTLNKTERWCPSDQKLNHGSSKLLLVSSPLVFPSQKVL